MVTRTLKTCLFFQSALPKCQNKYQVLEIYAYALDCKALPHPSTINDLEMSMNLRIIFSYVLIND